MKHLVRYALNAVTALSLLLCVAASVLWVRSYWRVDAVTETRYRPWGHPTFDARSLHLARGRLLLLRAETTHVGSGGPLEPSRTVERTSSALAGGAAGGVRTPWPSHVVFTAAGFEFARRDDQEERNRIEGRTGRRGVQHYSSVRGWSAVVPMWCLALVAGAPGLLTGLLGRRLRHRDRRAAAGLCRRCGYDLRATPGRCPECGVVPIADKPSILLHE